MSHWTPYYWHPNRAAISITFDDGTPEQLKYAIPELDARGMKATFFVIQSPEKTLRKYDTQFRAAEWRAVAANGHEIGGHSVTHLLPEEMKARPEAAYQEVIECQKFLQDTIAQPITSYAYPFTYVDENVKHAVKAAFLQARGLVDYRGEDKYILPTDSIDLYDVPSIQVNDRNIHKAHEWLQTTYMRQAWTTFMFHGVGDNDKVYDNVSTRKFATFLNEVRSWRDVAVKRFDEAASRMRNRP